jgi:hypothetical protein
VAFFAFGAASGVAIALHLPARVLDDPVLGPFDDAPTDLTLGDRTKTGTAGIGVSPLMLGMGAIKLSRAYNQAYKHENLQKFDD